MKIKQVLPISPLLLLLHAVFILAAPRKDGNGIKLPVWKRPDLKIDDDVSAKVSEYCTPIFATDSAVTAFTSCAVTFNVPLETFDLQDSGSSADTDAGKFAAFKNQFDVSGDQFEGSDEFKSIKDRYTTIGVEGSPRLPGHMPSLLVHKIMEIPCFGECILKNSGIMNANGTANKTFFVERFSTISKGEISPSVTDTVIEYCVRKVEHHHKNRTASKPKETIDPKLQACKLNALASICVSKFSWDVCQYFALDD